MSLDPKVIKDIVDRTLGAIEKSKQEIYKIVENSRSQVELFYLQLEQTQEKIKKTIDEVDFLEKKDKLMRKKLVDVSRHFEKYKENDMRTIYEEASEVRVNYKMKEKEEQDLRKKRNELENSLKKAQEVLQSAKNIIHQITVAINFLSGHIEEEAEKTEESANESVYLGIRILEAVEFEKRKISRDIHDGPAQLLANVYLNADALKFTIQEDIQEGIKDLDRLKEHIRLALQETRQIMYDLKPGLLEDKDLNEALKALVDRFCLQNKCKGVFHTDGIEEAVDETVQIAVFRVVQEALNNVSKHACAKRAVVDLKTDKTHLYVFVSDDGKGFDPEKMKKDVSFEEEGFGLKGMEERVEQFYGKFSYESAIGKGTKIKFEMPKNKEVMLNVYRTH